MPRSPLLWLLLGCLPAMATAAPAAGPVQVGRAVDLTFETVHPYLTPKSVEHHLVHSQVIHLPGATYLAPHFSRFELAPGDYLVVRSPSGERSWRYEGLGKGDLGRSDGFWGIHVPGERLYLDLYSNGSHGERAGWGYRVDQVARGFAGLAEKAICGADDRENARCYQSTHPEIYQESRAVARLMIQGMFLCTGWLVGSEGHVMTNNHCLSTNAAAMDTDFEFLAEGSCLQSCGTLQCPGTIVASSSTLVATSSGLDYTLLKLPTNPTDTYGYFQLRAAGPVVGERIFLPQHPGGRGKEIAIFSTDPADESGYAEIAGITAFESGDGAAYFADTESGSSGSPVVASSDGCVVALHRGAIDCSHFGNTGATTYEIIAHLGASAPADAVVTSASCVDELDEIFADGFELGDTAAWSLARP